MKKILLTLSMLFAVLLLIAMPAQIQIDRNDSQIYREFEWDLQNSNFPNSSTGIGYISSVDADVAWAVGYDGSGGAQDYQVYTMTSNGGNNWWSGNIDTAPAGGSSAMIFGLDDEKAWVPIHSGNPQGIYYTGDGGNNWARQESADFNLNGSFPNVVHFFNQNDGFAQGDPVDGYYELYTTTDGGANWIRVPEVDIPAPLTGEWGVVGYYDVVGDNVWWGTCKGRVYRSNDKGYTWEVSVTPLGGSTYTDVRFKDASNGIAQDKNATSSGTICETSDGGVTWQAVTHTGNCFTNSFDYVPNTSNTYVTTGAATGFSGASYSHDGGHNWTDFEETEGIQFLATSWINPSTGWAGCFNDQANPNLGGMYKYTGTLVQEPMGTISGIVSDLDSGTPIEDAVIEFGDYDAVTDEDGEYSIFCPIGTYDLSCESIGFDSFSEDNLEIIENQVTEFNVELQNLLLPPTNLVATYGNLNVVLQWENPETNAEITNIVIYRDGEEIATLPGAPEFHVDSDVTTATYTYYVTIMYYDEYESTGSNEVTIDVVNANGVVTSQSSRLMGNSPNPFNPSTTISFSTSNNANFVNLEIFNLKGQKIKTLVDEEMQSGTHSIVWNGKDHNDNDIASGIYWYKLTTGDYTSTKKMILLK